MAPLQGLSGLYPDPQATDAYMDEGVLEAKANALDSDHSTYGSQYLGYSGTVPTESPFASMGVYTGWDEDDAMQYGGIGFDVGGEEIDRTPVTHSAPYPRGILQQSWGRPDDLALAGDQLQQLHGPDLGGQQLYNGNSPAGREEDTDYTTDRYTAPNENYLATVLDGQLKSQGGHSGTSYGGGNADTTQGYGVLNSLAEFQAGHSIRRVQHDRMPWNFTNTHGEQGVPFPGRHPVEQMPLDGPDSPYYEMGSIDGANVPWEGRIGDPTTYSQPPEPTTLPASSQSAQTDVWAWSGSLWLSTVISRFPVSGMSPRSRRSFSEEWP